MDWHFIVDLVVAFVIGSILLWVLPVALGAVLVFISFIIDAFKGNK